MEPDQSNRCKNIGAAIHLSTFSKYLFPLGNFILPLVFWMCHRKDSFIDKHGKACLNFQISVFLYAVGLIVAGCFGSFLYIIDLQNSGKLLITEYYISIFHQPFSGFLIFLWIIGFLIIALILFELICVIQAAVKASEGKIYRYPISIPFLKTSHENEEAKNTKNTSL